MLVCIAMYAVATTHWAYTLRALILEQQSARDLLDITSSCLATVVGGSACSIGVDALQSSSPRQVDPSLPTALLSVNVRLRDFYHFLMAERCLIRLS